MSLIENLAVVALLNDVPEHGFVRGQVGTVVESLSPLVVEVEFSDEEGRAYATAAMRTAELMVPYHSPVRQLV